MSLSVSPSAPLPPNTLQAAGTLPQPQSASGAAATSGTPAAAAMALQSNAAASPSQTTVLAKDLTAKQDTSTDHKKASNVSAAASGTGVIPSAGATAAVTGSAAEVTSSKSDSKLAAAGLKDVTREVITINKTAFNLYVSKLSPFRHIYGHHCCIQMQLEDSVMKTAAKCAKLKVGLAMTKDAFKKAIDKISADVSKKFKDKPEDLKYFTAAAKTTSDFYEKQYSWNTSGDKPFIILAPDPKYVWMKVALEAINYFIEKCGVTRAGKIGFSADEARVFQLRYSAPDPIFLNCLEWALVRTHEVRAKDYIFGNTPDAVRHKFLLEIVANLQSWNYASVEFENLQANDLVVYLDGHNKPVHVAFYVGNGKFESKFGIKNTFRHHHKLFDTPLSDYETITKALFFRKPAETAAAPAQTAAAM